MGFPVTIGEGERFNPDEVDGYANEAIGKVFNDSKEEVWKLFISYYRNDDRDPSFELPKFENPFKNFMKQLRQTQINVFNPDDFSLGIRRRLKRTKPFDENGEPCVNPFMKLFG